VVRRSRTNTPLQALSLLNEPTFMEAAQGLARRMIAEGGDTPADRIAHGFRLSFGRRPAAEELAVLVDGVAADHAHFDRAPDAAEKLLPAGGIAAPEGVAPAEFAAYVLAANVIINLDEFVTRD